MNRNAANRISQTTIMSRSGATPMSAAQPHRQSAILQSGKSLIDSLPRNSSTITSSNQQQPPQTDRSNILRASANSQITGPRQKYSYHQSKPAIQGEKVGEYVTKEARIEKAQEIKSAHFKLGYPSQAKTMDPDALKEEQNIKQKWNPQSVIAKTNLAVSNWQLGKDQAFDGLTQTKKDFPDHGAHFDPNQKAKRLELANQLRKSNLPPSNFQIPKSTAQDSYAQGASKEDEAQAIKQRKEEAEKVFARVRGVKPNFSLGNHKLDYLSENKDSMQPKEFVASSKSKLVEQAAINRQHNFKMSFEQGSQFQTDAKGAAYKLPAAKVNEDRYSKKGASNMHQVQIGDTKVKHDYKSSTAIQQVGHQNSSSDPNGLKSNASYKDVREKIAQHTKDLRSSHFALGIHNQPAQASSAVMFTAPPPQALISNTNETREAREKLQKSNFSIKDAHGSNGPATTTSQANNLIRQQQMASGQIVSAQPVPKPIDSIDFGQSRDYTSTAKSSYIGLTSNARKQQLEEQQRFKDKFNKQNINFGSSPSRETMISVSQANNEQAAAQQNRIGAVKVADLNAQNKENALKMRGANFKMGSILPEHNNYRVSQLDTKQQESAKNSSRFRSMGQQSQVALNSQTVSSGNNIAKGSGNFRTINQELTNWIQPSAVAK